MKRNREHPQGFQIPGEEEKQAIEPGVFVKLLFDTTDLWGRRNWGERMWVKVTAINKRHIVGMLDNDPIGIPRLYRGDQLKFKHHHIIDIIMGARRLLRLPARARGPLPPSGPECPRGVQRPLRAVDGGSRTAPRRHTRSLDAVA